MVFYCVGRPHFIYPSIQLWMDSGSLPALGESEQCCWERGCTPLCLNPRFKYFWLIPIAGAARACANSTFTVSGNCHIASHGPCSVLRSHQQCTSFPVSHILFNSYYFPFCLYVGVVVVVVLIAILTGMEECYCNFKDRHLEKLQ